LWPHPASPPQFRPHPRLAGSGGTGGNPCRYGRHIERCPVADDTMKRYSRLATPLHKAVEVATRPVFKKRGIAESRLITEWANIAGEVLAGKTLPKRVAFPQGKRDNGTLHLSVAPGWALEVQHLEPIILDKIATYFG